MRKNSLTLSTWNTLETRALGYQAGQAVSKTLQVRTSSACSNFKPHEEDPSLVNASQKQNFKFQATGSPRRTWYFLFSKKYESEQKSQYNKEPTSRKGKHLPIRNDLTVYFGQCILTKDDLFARNTALLLAYWQTVYVYARSIRYAIDFSTAVRRRASKASTDYSFFSGSKGHLRLSA